MFLKTLPISKPGETFKDIEVILLSSQNFWNKSCFTIKVPLWVAKSENTPAIINLCFPFFVGIKRYPSFSLSLYLLLKLSDSKTVSPSNLSKSLKSPISPEII